MTIKLSGFNETHLSSINNLGFAWTGVSLSFNDQESGAHPSLSVEVPVNYKETDSVLDVRNLAFSKAVEVLRAALRECEEREREGLVAFQKEADEAY